MKTQKEIKAKIAKLKSLALNQIEGSAIEALEWVLAPGKPKTKVTFTVNYVIGDADGETTKKRIIKVKNPFLKPIGAALKKLQTKKGCWGLMLSEPDYEWNFKKKYISKFEFDLLCLASNYHQIEETELLTSFCKQNGLDEDETVDDLMEFEGLLVDDASYSFLTYQGHTIK